MSRLPAQVERKDEVRMRDDLVSDCCFFVVVCLFKLVATTSRCLWFKTMTEQYMCGTTDVTLTKVGTSFLEWK